MPGLQRQLWHCAWGTFQRWKSCIVWRYPWTALFHREAQVKNLDCLNNTTRVDTTVSLHPSYMMNCQPDKYLPSAQFHLGWPPSRRKICSVHKEHTQKLTLIQTKRSGERHFKKQGTVKLMKGYVWLYLFFSFLGVWTQMPVCGEIHCQNLMFRM